MKSRLEGAGVPVSTIPIQPLGMSVLEGSVSPGYRRRLVQLAASLSPSAELGAAQDEDACATDVDAASPSHHQPSPPTVPPIDLSNFVVTMSMASHSLQVLHLSFCPCASLVSRRVLTTPPSIPLRSPHPGSTVESTG